VKTPYSDDSVYNNLYTKLNSTTQLHSMIMEMHYKIKKLVIKQNLTSSFKKDKEPKFHFHSAQFPFNFTLWETMEH
jgi:hypothetical protein